MPSFFPSFSLSSHESASLIQLEIWGADKLPQVGPERSPTANAFLVY